MKKVLLVEDKSFYHQMYQERLGDKVEIISAFTIEEAEQLFSSEDGFDAIVMDACVPGDSPTTPPLVRMIRETFTGPMIAISSLNSYRHKLMEAGCDYEATKAGLPQKLITILGL